jgi:hypothetical protein
MQRMTTSQMIGPADTLRYTSPVWIACFSQFFTSGSVKTQRLLFGSDTLWTTLGIDFSNLAYSVLVVMIMTGHVDCQLAVASSVKL